MKFNFKCPRCKAQTSIGKHLHAVWTCPECQNSLVPTREMRFRGTANISKKRYKKYNKNK